MMFVSSLFIYCTLLEVHKNISDFNIQSDIHYYPTRSSSLLRTRCFRLTKSQKNSLNLNIYNKLPENIKLLDYSCFKRKIKYLILRNCFYSVADYLDATLIFS